MDSNGKLDIKENGNMTIILNNKEYVLIDLKKSKNKKPKKIIFKGLTDYIIVGKENKQ